MSAAVIVPPARNNVTPFVGTLTVLPANRENVMPVLECEVIAPPELPAELFVSELVVSVSGPLSTRMAPPLPFGALLLLKLEVATL